MSQKLMDVWKRFDQFPMETLTKYWIAKYYPNQRQRTVVQMKEHYEQYRITGNCFDLALWLIDAFRDKGIEAYGIGHDLLTEDAHVAVLAFDENKIPYLCDLGDQWIKPLPLNESKSNLIGYFPGAIIDSDLEGKHVSISYHRANGKTSKQTYDLTPIDDSLLWTAAEKSQLRLNDEPLLEVRIIGDEVTHWEFYAWRSFTSTMDGKIDDSPLQSIEEWALRIHEKTNYPIAFLIEVLTMYKQKQTMCD